MPTTTPNFGWSVPVSTDLVKDGATAIELLGDSIDASLLDLKGGTTGQVLAKASNTDLDFTFVTVDDTNAIQNAIVDAKGDLIGATAADTPARLAVGANGTVLTADSAEATGLKWATPASGGKVLQVVTATHSTAVSTTSASLQDTNLTATITPSAASSKILVICAQSAHVSSTGANGNMNLAIVRTSTTILDTATNGLAYSIPASANGQAQAYVALSVLDSPNTTSATTYKTQMSSGFSATTTVQAQKGGSTSTITLLEIGA